MKIYFLLVILAVSLLNACSIKNSPEKSQLYTGDIDLFWEVYEYKDDADFAEKLKTDYIKVGSKGLKSYYKSKIGSTETFKKVLDARPGYYADLKPISLKVEQYKPEILASFKKLQEIYPQARFPDVYFVIGAMSSGGTAGAVGLMIGVDMYGRTDSMPVEELSNWHRQVLLPIEEVPGIVAHELIHFQQSIAGALDRSLLGRSIREGAADFVGNMIAGKNINEHIYVYGDAHEKELWEEFKAQMYEKDASNWLYNGNSSKDRPADLGYYIGYQICEAYYEKAEDKQKAVRDILKVKNGKKFLELSGYNGE